MRWASAPAPEQGERPCGHPERDWNRPSLLPAHRGGSSFWATPAKAKNKLGWEPKISFEQLIGEMVQADLKEAEKERDIKRLGHKTFNYFE